MVIHTAPLQVISGMVSQNAGTGNASCARENAPSVRAVHLSSNESGSRKEISTNVDVVEEAVDIGVTVRMRILVVAEEAEVVAEPLRSTKRKTVSLQRKDMDRQPDSQDLRDSMKMTMRAMTAVLDVAKWYLSRVEEVTGKVLVRSTTALQLVNRDRLSSDVSLAWIHMIGSPCQDMGIG